MKLTERGMGIAQCLNTAIYVVAQAHRQLWTTAQVILSHGEMGSDDWAGHVLYMRCAPRQHIQDSSDPSGSIIYPKATELKT